MTFACGSSVGMVVNERAPQQLTELLSAQACTPFSFAAEMSLWSTTCGDSNCPEDPSAESEGDGSSSEAGDDFEWYKILLFLLEVLLS